MEARAYIEEDEFTKAIIVCAGKENFREYYAAFPWKDNYSPQDVCFLLNDVFPTLMSYVHQRVKNDIERPISSSV